jgi:hypothetical protein
MFLCQLVARGRAQEDLELWRQEMTPIEVSARVATDCQYAGAETQSRVSEALDGALSSLRISETLPGIHVFRYLSDPRSERSSVGQRHRHNIFDEM